ncbi:MAG TPA: FkbM family methyltransferase [Verrucomicrobiae bacterium]|jgi:FkbM family methyltransferase
MNPIVKIATALYFVANHPLNRNRKFRAVAEYGFIQVAARLVPGEICLEFPNRTRLLVSPKMKGAAHFITPRLCEFNDMSFVMHFLRAGEMFADVGANVGAFTILAAGVAGAKAVSFEPSPETFEMLSRNARLNGLLDRVRPVNAAVGRSAGNIQFSAGLGTENHVAATNEKENSVTVPMTTLDNELAASPAVLLKVDVEGFETEVFGGAEKTLKNPDLQAIIVERNGSGNRYGYDEEKLHAQIRSHGFNACGYEPFKRQARPLESGDGGNIIYIRDLKSANERLRTAPAFELGSFKA